MGMKERDSPRKTPKKMNFDPNYLRRIRKYCSFCTSGDEEEEDSDDQSQYTLSSSHKKGTSKRSSVVGVPKRTMLKKDTSKQNKSIGSNTVLKKQLTKGEKMPD